jgi:uncharacterized phage-like protein YoqJ
MVNMVAFTGHRHWKYSDVKAFLDEIVKKYGKDAVWICGGAVGLDSHAARYAMENKIRLWLVLPFAPAVMSMRWNSAQKELLHKTIKYAEKLSVLSTVYDIRFYQERNERMVDLSQVLCAFFDGSAGGTANCVRYARYIRHPVEVYNPKH